MDQPPPLARLLNTNSVLTDREAADLNLFLNAQQSALDDLDREIQVLVDRRAALARVIEQYSALLSPIRRVPPDILLSIFEYTCLKGLTPARYLEAPAEYPSQVVLSHVCREWRRLSLDHPLLWSEICISSPPRPALDVQEMHPATLEDFKVDLAEYEEQIGRTKARCLAHISRSDPVPLTITFHAQDSPLFGTDAYFSFPDFNGMIVDMLCGVSRRWKRVSFCLWISREDSPLLRLIGLTPENFPLLEQLELKPTLIPRISDDFKAIGLLNAGHLRSLRLGNHLKCRYQPDFNWKSLTELHYHGPINEVIEILRSLPQLICCSLVTDFPFTPNHPQIHAPAPPPHSLHLAQPISLPHLRSLVICKYLPDGLASSLRLPSLRRLALHSGGAPQAVENSIIVDWVRRFGSQLIEFTFHYRYLTESALMYTLENLPNLETLRLYGGLLPPGTPMSMPMGPLNPLTAVLNDSFLEKLTPLGRGTEDGSSLPLCPKLRRISLWPLGIEFTEKAFAKLIAARRDPRHTCVSRLEAAFALLHSPRSRDLRKVLEEDFRVDLQGFTLVFQNYQTVQNPWPPQDDFIAEEFAAIRQSV